MKVLDVRPKGIYFTLEFSYEQLQHLEEFLDHSKCTYNGEREPTMIRSNAYVVDEFYPGLRELLRNYRDGA